MKNWYRQSQAGRSWASSYSTNSAALEGTDDFDSVASGQRRRRPFGAAHHGAVDGDGKKPGLGIDALLGQQLGDRRDRDFGFRAVDPETHHRASAPAAARRPRVSAATKRSGDIGRAISGNRPVNI